MQQSKNIWTFRRFSDGPSRIKGLSKVISSSRNFLLVNPSKLLIPFYLRVYNLFDTDCTLVLPIFFFIIGGAVLSP
jgi:hypothetical protein